MVEVAGEIAGGTPPRLRAWCVLFRFRVRTRRVGFGTTILVLYFEAESGYGWFMGRGSDLILRDKSGGVVAPPQIDHVDPPDHLSETAAELWRELMPELVGVGMLTTHDLLGFGQLCEAYSDWCTARATLALNGGNYYREQRQGRDGVIIEGNWKLHPAYYALSDADRRLRGWCQEFSLSPAVRVRFMNRTPVKNPQIGAPEDEAVDLTSLTIEERETLRTLALKRQHEAQEAREGDDG